MFNTFQKNVQNIPEILQEMLKFQEKVKISSRKMSQENVENAPENVENVPRKC